VTGDASTSPILFEGRICHKITRAGKNILRIIIFAILNVEAKKRRLDVIYAITD